LHALPAPGSALPRLRYELASLRMDVALARLRVSLKAGFNEPQPRDDGGRWICASLYSHRANFLAQFETHLGSWRYNLANYIVLTETARAKAASQAAQQAPSPATQ
jgi:hypothetical protein